ncbi:ent-copalyl diphosphate synthase 1-like [Telopea speciosissima]|uniref:ent-copalyl diphosphate synthase 1-like n=1 Tax=Telopea speciosissima TaxID=54955 RepID=UPI001CC3C525|nr:ent-copalyl diphosphate synthase 1-like [Telopea speciosissima]
MSPAAFLLCFTPSAFLYHLPPIRSPLSLHTCSIAARNKLGRDNQANFGLLRCSRSSVICNSLTHQRDRESAAIDVCAAAAAAATATATAAANEIDEKIKSIRSMLGSMEDGKNEISISAYDTAWVALVEDINGSGVPQFPSTLQWVMDNQLPDGSWGDFFTFSAYDRILSTLACVIALKSWNVCQELWDKGIVFIEENISKLESENEEQMLSGFELSFPSLLEMARKKDIQVLKDRTPFLEELYAKRNRKFSNIPKDMMHRVPTIILFSLEGMAGYDLDWEKLLKLQCKDGSFLTSPAATAFALMQTKDERCLEYLKKTAEKFNGGVPNFYPLDLYERTWGVDRLERLGISRYFQSEIKECINYVYRYWTEKGVGWARGSRVCEVDSTSMGFRLLRLHGYDISPGAFGHFKEGDEFFVNYGQLSQSITAMSNLYRASQVLFPGEKILEEAKAYSSKFLRIKQASGQLVDKWIITKDLPGEVEYVLDIPWYASLPRVEARYYIEHYGGFNDVWIGKTLCRLYWINNNDYLELAKSDFNNCQALHQMEWTTTIQKWYAECNLDELGVGRRELLHAYFVATASIFEPERASERLAWVRVAVLMDAVYLFVKMDKRLVEAINTTLDCIARDTLVAHGVDIGHQLRCAWNIWLQKGREGEGEFLVQMINLCGGRLILKEHSSHPHYQRLLDLTSTICCQLRPLINSKGLDMNNSISIADSPIEPLMQELVQLVLMSSHGIDSEIKRVFLTIAKSFYYAAHCTSATIDQHIVKVLFDKVV